MTSQEIELEELQCKLKAAHLKKDNLSEIYINTDRVSANEMVQALQEIWAIEDRIKNLA